MVMEPNTTGMTVLAELMFANVLLRFDSIQVEAILNVGNSWSRQRHKYTNAHPAFGVSCKWKRYVRSLNPAAADVLPGADESPSPHDWLSVEIGDMQRRVSVKTRGNKFLRKRESQI